MGVSGAFQRAPGAPQLPATPLSFLLYFVGRFRGWYALMFLLEAANSTCTILVPYATGQIIHAVTQARAGGPALPARLHGPLLLFALLAVGEVVFSRLGGACQIRIGPRQRHAVTRALYAYLQHHSHRYLSNDFAGSLAHRISETSMGVSQTLWTVIFDFWPMTLVFILAVCILGQASRGLAALVGVWALCFIAASFLLARRCRPYAVRASATRSESTGKVVDAVTNLSSTRLFARLEHERSHLDEQLSRELAAVNESNGYSERVRWFQYAAAALLKVVVLGYSLTLFSRGEIGVAELVVACSTALLVINEARNLSRRFLEFFEFIGNVANGVHTIVQEHEIVDAPGAQAARITRGRIELEDVHFAYASGQPIFTGLSVTIPAGQRVGLVGFSGSGKSTFVSLILRLYDPQTGRIRIDGQDIRLVTQQSLHEQMSLIPQEPNLFHRSLMDNIRYGRLTATDDEVMEAARKAHAHDFIMQIKDGYESLVGERGVKLSGGQRQRVALARVFVKGSPIVILDEATSSLDSVTEQVIQATLEDATRGRTVIVVAHRLSTVAHLDRILVFDQGRIVEDGTHEELLAQRSIYHRLWSRQARGFMPEEGSAGDRAAAPQEGPASGEAEPEELIGHDRPREEAEDPMPAARVRVRSAR